MPPYVPPYQEDEGESSEGDSISVSSSNNHELELYRQSKPGIQNTFTPSDIPRHPKPPEDRHVPLARREKIRDYRAPQDGNGKPLSSSIYIYGQAAEDLKANFIGAYQWPISPGCDGPKTARRNLLSITSARRWFDDSKHRVDITCSANLERWATPMGSHTMWLHVERQKQTMEEFEVIASNIPELPENWKLLIRGAFKKFRDNPDFDAHVGWVFRADGIESDWIRDREAPPTVTCISIPYFFLGPKDDHESPGRSLYQWEDPKESSRQWDAYQSYPKMADEKDSKSRIIYIRTIWALIAGHVVLTYGPMDFDDLTDGFIEQIVPKPNAMTSPDVVQVTDLNGCNHILSMRECRTFFDLTQAIVDQIILKQPLPSAGDVEYISSDGLVLDGSSWLTTVQSETSEMVKIRLRHTPEPAPKPTSLQRLPSHVSELKGVKESKGVSATVHVDAQNTDDSDGHYLDSSGNESRAMILHSHGSELRTTSEPTEFTKIGYPTSLVISEQLASKAYPDYPSRSGLHTGRKSPPGSRERKQQRKRAETPPGDSSNLHRSNDLKRNKELLINQNTTKNLPSIFKPLDMNSAGASHRFEQRSNSPNLSRAETPEISSRDQQNGRKVSTGLANGDSSEQKDRNSADRNSASTRLEIQPPPFLSWASSPETNFKYDTEASRTGLKYVERILESIHIILKETQSTRNRRLYRRALEINDTELQKSFPFLEFTKIRLTQSQNTPEFKKSEASTTGQQTLESFGFDDIDSADLVHSHLLKGISKATEELFQLYRKFLSLYVPLCSTHEILQKCWGAFHSILSTIQKGLQRDKEMREQSEPTYWVVRDIANDPALSQNLKKAFLPWTECGSCRSGRIYREYSESERHVKIEHFGISDKGGKQPELPRHTLKAWLRDNHQYRTDQRLNLYQTYLRLALDHIRTLFSKARSIRDAAINTQAPQITRYLLPRSLVASFENAIMMLLYTSNAVITVSRYSNHFQENKQSTEKDQEATALLRRVKEDLEASGHAASNSMDSAVKDILLMTLTDVDTRIVRYDEVGPEYIVAAVLDKLCNRPLHETERIEQVYSSFVRKLSLDARAHPRRRIIGDIWHLQEEVNIVRSIVHTQSMLMYDYIEVINPRHFPTTSYERSYRFNAENQFLFHAENERNRAWKELYTLESRLVTLKRHVLQMLEVQRESDGNALLVFTVVSVIFLPLSWATSYLGMNTKDIRDMEKDQWLFWAIAVPITSLVIGLAILVLLKGDDLREFILTRSTARSRGSDKTQELHESLSMKAPTMVSTYNEEKTQLRGWNRPRRRRGAGFGSKV